MAKFRRALAPNSNRNYWIGVLIMLLGIAAVIGHGLYHHRLPTSTLTFRWQYWVGSVGVLRQHPLLGVGWSNFGLSYLAHRLPQAPEEIKDPHNFLVRFFAELGIVGGLLVIAWQLRLWRELTRPLSPSPIESPTGPGTINFLAAVIAAATAIWLLVGVDLAREPFETYLVRLVFFGAAVVASSLAALRSIHSQELDGSSAPWILLAVILAIGGMFLHNLIDFSMFEIGPMMLLFLLIGAMLGLRQPPIESHRPGGKAALAIASLPWLAALFGIWAPIMNAEQDATDADDAVRAARFPDAEKLYAQANTTLHGLNSDYIYRAAVVSPPEEGPARLQLAIDQNPKNAVYRFDAARAQMLRLNPDVSTIRRDFDAGLALDPNNVAARLEYAKWLARIGDADAAHREFQRAVNFNNLLNPDENKRLAPEQLDKERRDLDLSLKR
jgi:tetratricopeptide (TPR) repeat protein